MLIKTINIMKVNLKEKGFSLLEVLVSIIVLALGLLGLAALQTTAMRYNHDSYVRSLVVNQAYSMSDRMRANRAGINAGAYNALSGNVAAPACSNCNPTQAAQRDFSEWNTANSQLLPAGQGTVTANGTLFNITVMWDNDKTGATGTNCSGNPQVDLECLTIGITP